MKKLIALLLVLATCASLFVGCDDFEEEPTGGGTIVTSPTIDGATADIDRIKEKGPDKITDGATLSLWVRDQSSCVTDYQNNLMTRWYQAKTGVTINWTVVPEDGAEDKFTTSLASGSLPDIYNYYMTPTTMTLYGGPDGVFVAIDDLIAQGWMPNLEKYLAENPIFEGMRSADGKLYAIPSYSESPHMLYVKKTWVNKNWLEQYIAAGGKTPETTVEFEQMLQFFKDNDMNGNGDNTDEVPMSGCQGSGWGTDPFVWLISPFALAIGDGYEQFLTADEEGNVTWIAGTDEYRDGLRWAHSLLEKGLLDEGTYTQNNESYRQLVTDNVLGVATGAEESQFCDDVSMYSNWVALAPMEGPTGLRQAPVYDKRYSSLSYCIAITKDCKNLEVAAKWLDYFFSEEGKIVASCGFEGLNYDYSETPAVDGSTPSIVRYPDADSNLNTRWGNRICPSIDTSLKECDSEGSNTRLYAAARIYEPYLTETGIPLVAFPLSAEEETMKSEAFNYVVFETYYKGFRFITGRKDRDLFGGTAINLDINNDEHWQAYLDWVSAGGYLDTYISLTEKKFFGNEG